VQIRRFAGPAVSRALVQAIVRPPSSSEELYPFGEQRRDEE
jgi:hypothetical protein